MSVTTTTHLNFRGDARAALEFYQSVFDGHLVLVTYKDAGNVQEESEADQVMWGQVLAGNGFHVMAYDVPSKMAYDQERTPSSSPCGARRSRRSPATGRSSPPGRAW